MSATDSSEFPPFDNKDLDALIPSFENSFDNFFDQYFSQDEDFPDSSDNSNESNFFDDLDIGSTVDVPLVEPKTSKATIPQYQPLHSWRANAWRHHKVTPVPRSQKLVHRLRPNGVTISSTELLTLEGKLQGRQADLSIFPSRPSTPPVTPRRTKQSSRSGSPATPTRGTLIAKSTVSPKMMRPSYYAKQESPSFHEWTERFQQFSLQGQSSNFPLSPPSSANVSQHEQPPKHVIPDQSSVSISPVSPNSFAQHTSRLQTQFRVSSGEVYTPTMQEARNSAWWMQSTDLDFTASVPQSRPDWSAIRYPSHPYGQTVETHDQTHALDLTPVPPDFASQGLMIQCDPFDDPFQGIQPSGEYLASAFEPFFPEPRTEDDEIYPPEMSPGIGAFTISQTKSTSRTQSPSPPSTPLSPTKSRRQARHIRGKSSSSSTPKTPKILTAGTGMAGFVNFTPSDSRKILTGVAPSGSSKTKARREKEASDRRRKLSEAAAKAVMEAGGDVEALRKEGLLI